MPVQANNMELFVYSTTRNVAYVHQRLDLIVELCRTFLIVTWTLAITMTF